METTKSELWDVMRAGGISDSLIQGYNLTHTIQLISHAETTTGRERIDGMLRTIAELKLVYKESKQNLTRKACEIIEDTLNCAENDLREEKYWAAVVDVHGIEKYFLQKYLPQLPHSDNETRVNLLLARKIVRSLGGEIVFQKNGGEDPADWWKR